MIASLEVLSPLDIKVDRSPRSSSKLQENWTVQLSDTWIGRSFPFSTTWPGRCGLRPKLWPSMSTKPSLLAKSSFLVSTLITFTPSHKRLLFLVYFYVPTLPLPCSSKEASSLFLIKLFCLSHEEKVGLGEAMTVDILFTIFKTS